MFHARPTTKTSADHTRCALVIVLAFFTIPATAMIDLKPGDRVPALTLTSIQNTPVNTASTDIQILLFGQTNHERTKRACEYIQDALENTQLDGTNITWIYILSKNSDPKTVNACGQDAIHAPVIVHDKSRKAFGAFGIITMPSVIIVDAQSRVVHTMPGLSPRFGDIVSSALLLAANKIEPDEFKQVLHPTAAPPSNNRKRAQRIVKLARQAVHRGMDDMAITQYTRAIEIDPSYTQARLALGYILIQNAQLDEAQGTFETILEQDPVNTNAQLGLASVHIKRIEGDLGKAETIIREVLRREPNNPRAHYTYGLLFEKREQFKAASERFKKAAGYLLNTADPDLATAIQE